MHIQPVSLSRDLAQVIALYQRCFAEAPWFERFDPDELQQMFTQMNEWPDTVFLVAREDDQVMGASIAFHIRRKPDVCEALPMRFWNSYYLAELFVDPRVRRQGVAERLIQQRWERIHQKGCMDCVVRTSVQQSIIQKIYADHGYTETARQEVVSTKWIDGEEVQAPDTRVILTGVVPWRIRNPPVYRGCHSGY